MNELVLKTQDDVIALANDFIKNNNIIPSKNYNVTSAMIGMFNNVLAVKDKNGKSVLETCTPASIQNAIYQCISEELTPNKNQLYFIPYNGELTAQRSYFGNAKRAKDVAGVVIYSKVVHEGDEIDAEVRANGTMIIRHKPNLKNLNKPIIMAYAIASNEITGEIIDSDVMTMEEIKKSWAKSRTGGTVSKEFPHEMARRTVTNRLAKHIINTSNDSADIYITDIDGKRIKVNQYDDLPQETSFDYVINTDEQESFEKETYIPSEDSVITSEDLKLDNISALEVNSVEGSFEISYAEYKNNTDVYDLVPNSWNPKTKTVFVKNK